MRIGVRGRAALVMSLVALLSACGAQEPAIEAGASDAGHEDGIDAAPFDAGPIAPREAGSDAPEVSDDAGTDAATDAPASVCGDGVVSGDEACDVAVHACCAAGCATVASPATICRAAVGDCDVAEVCDGASAACPDDVVASSETRCRAAADVCDVEEHCDGVTTACPDDLPSGPGIACRAAAGACDLAEACTGSSTACPNDVLVGSGVVCRAATGACDVAEACSGSTPTCPDDAFADGSVVCRPAAGSCDVAEACTGFAASCPVDARMSVGVACRGAVSDCDAIERCDGLAVDCPSDAADSIGAPCTDCSAGAGACGGCDGAGVCLDLCGNGAIDAAAGEQCEPELDAACPGRCTSTCTCAYAESCLAIRESSAGSPSGTYTIRPPGSVPITVYCDMTTAGGGWTLVGRWMPYPQAAHSTRSYLASVESATFPTSITDVAPAFVRALTQATVPHDQVLLLTAPTSTWIRVGSSSDLWRATFLGTGGTYYVNQSFAVLESSWGASQAGAWMCSSAGCVDAITTAGTYSCGALRIPLDAFCTSAGPTLAFVR